MKVLKFGGTSVGSAQRMKEVAKLITDGERKIVVLSAMSGTTNTLVEISDYLYKKNPEGANEIINQLESKYRRHIDELYSTDEYKQKCLELVRSHFDYIRSYTKDLFTLFEEKVVLAQGELISTGMMNYYLQECGVKSVLLPALEYMRTDKNAEPDPVYIREKLQAQLELHPDADIYITQGFICRNAYGEIDNLQRGGSDYTASLVGAAINATYLAQITAKYGKFAVWGNHDAWQKHEKITAALQNVGIVVLANSNRRVECRNKVFYIAGVEDMTTGRPNVERALQGVKPPVVLLSHSPDVFPLVPDTVVLTLAGHTHGGQVRLPFVGAPIANSRYGQKYLYGLKEENGHRLIVTAGLGTSLLPMRFGSVPEIVVIGWQ